MTRTHRPARHRYIVARVDQIPPGQRKIVTVARRSIGIFNVGGTFRAIRNQCPHAGGPLCEGRVSGFVRSDDPGKYQYVRRGEILRCPWHGWEFDLLTGKSWFDPATTRVRIYETSVEDGRLLRDGVDADKELVQAGLVPGPYQIELYEVEIDREYVVIYV